MMIYTNTLSRLLSLWTEKDSLYDKKNALNNKPLKGYVEGLTIIITVTEKNRVTDRYHKYSSNRFYGASIFILALQCEVYE